MRSIIRTGDSPRRTLDPITRDVAALCAAGVVVGLSFGAIASAAGLPLSQIVAMSVFIYAGGAQFLAIGLVGAGATTVAVVLAGLLLNARHLPFGLAIGSAPLGDRWAARLLGSHLMTDESVAFALAQEDPARRRRAYWMTGIGLFLTWNVASAIGAVAGSALGDPNTFGIDAAFPAALLALTLPSLKDKTSVRVAVGGAALALATTPFLPAGLPVLVALVALALALPVPQRKRTAA
ncbi:AzlC family ABC transporter permease [Dactylosporangium sp. AC04546]|uniref:AzlC family ABC transporter permease n=1 Tax=Dactylosporangium sp. AC04546 TaxID=2862460 RepID=UPI001EDF72E9|nr:AzlC family ABC transporter permease [Dactylosporangium sp. AC04546]WVK84147.1 AzlC family ABC transporter permease [Dactylosporangium sp. AC04546]